MLDPVPWIPGTRPGCPRIEAFIVLVRSACAALPKSAEVTDEDLQGIVEAALAQVRADFSEVEEGQAFAPTLAEDQS